MEIARQSSRRLSRSSFSLFSSSIRFEEKKFVGGSCLGSPTITTFSPLAIVPAASAVGSCEASSKITRSNFGNDGSIYCATDMGLMSIQGQSLRRRFGILSKRLLSDIILPLLFMARLSMPISEVEAQAEPWAGIFAERRAKSSCIVRRENLSRVSLNCVIRSFALLLLNWLRRLSPFIIISAS